MRVFTAAWKRLHEGAVAMAAKRFGLVDRERRGRCLAFALVLSVLVTAGEALAFRRAGEELTLAYQGQTVVIRRHDYGVPYVYAPTLPALFFGSGYVAAADRLWQAELNRRAATGRMAELLGPGANDSYVQQDIAARRDGYTPEELMAQFLSLDRESQQALLGYLAGINRYISEAVADEDKLPVEFRNAGILPSPWTVLDLVATVVFYVRRFGEAGGYELESLKALRALQAKHGEQKGRAIWDAVVVTNDPESPTTVPPRPAGKQASDGDEAEQARHAGAGQAAILTQSALEALSARLERERQAAQYVFATTGIPYYAGSNAWVVAPSRSARGSALLLGGPQMGHTIPEIVHEVGLVGAGIRSVGMTFAGVSPFPLIGRGPDHAWTTTSGIGDQVDFFVEKLHPDDPYRYWHQGEWKGMERRTEVIQVRGREPVRLEVLRTVHGPVVQHNPAEQTAVSVARTHWMREMHAVVAFLEFNRARDLYDFAEAVRRIPTSHNFLWVDRQGNIGYWLAGRPPVRPDHVDPRLPLRGTGEDEWLGVLPPERMPALINPPQGFIANWNNRPSADWEDGAMAGWGPTHRAGRIMEALRARPTVTFDDMNAVNRQLSFLHLNYAALRPLIERAVRRAGAGEAPLSDRAREVAAILLSWDGVRQDADGDGYADHLAEPIFELWYGLVRDEIFLPLLGEELMRMVSADHLYRALAGSRPSPAFDFLGGRSAQALILSNLERAAQAWAARQSQAKAETDLLARMPTTTYTPLGALPAIETVAMNRGTWNLIVELGPGIDRSVSAYAPGQSGFVGPGGPAPHTHDQLPLYVGFEYKPLPLDPFQRGEP